MIPSWATTVKVAAVVAAGLAGKALPGGTGAMVAAGVALGAILAGYVWLAAVRRFEAAT